MSRHTFRVGWKSSPPVWVSECWVAYVLACVVLRLEGVLPSLEAGMLGFRVSRHTFSCRMEVVLPCLEVITPNRVCPGIRNSPNTVPTRCVPVGFDKSRMPWHAECAGNTPARTLDWLPLAATGHTSRNTPVRHGHPMIMNPNDLRQRKTLRAIFMSSPTGFMQLVLRCDVADAATVDRCVATSVSATQAFGLLP